MKQAVCFQSSFNRTNLFYEVRKKSRNVRACGLACLPVDCMPALACLPACLLALAGFAPKSGQGEEYWPEACLNHCSNHGCLQMLDEIVELANRHKKASGIVYCLSRNETEKCASDLQVRLPACMHRMLAPTACSSRNLTSGTRFFLPSACRNVVCLPWPTTLGWTPTSVLRRKTPGHAAWCLSSVPR